MNILISIALLAFAGLFREGDAAITEWTTPIIAATAANGVGLLTVQESQAINTDIETYVAVTDETVTTCTYALETAVTPFALSTTGALTITATLDARTTSSYTLNIVATDDGDATGTAAITVTVTAAPAFGASSYSQCMTDGSVADTAVITVLAVDPDSGTSITHSINSGDTGSDFKIDGSTGAITVNTGKTLSTTTASYTLVIHAVDNETPTAQTGSTTVTVTVAATCSSAVALGISITAILMINLVSML